MGKILVGRKWEGGWKKVFDENYYDKDNSNGNDDGGNDANNGNDKNKNDYYVDDQIMWKSW